MSCTDSRRANRVGRESTDATIRSFLAAIDSPKSLAVWLLYSSGEHDQLLQLECDPGLYFSPSTFRDDYQAICLLSKSTFLRTSFNRTDVAMVKFSKSEDKCREVNRSLWPYSTPDYMPAEELHPLLPRVQRKIRSILGRFDPEEMVDCSDWGPGVSTLLKGPTSVKPNKYQQETGMTHEVYSVVWPLLKLAYPTWWQEVLKFRDPVIEMGNTVITVPKNSKTDRVIAVEPGFNLWFQKGIGSMIRKRLLRRGCNLNDQSVNQRLSKLAYARDFATVDFSAASDTIAYETVRLLLPPEWFKALKLFRCKSGKLKDGTILRWQKFSSMGNGYTFELESLIFYALALVVTEELDPQNLDGVSVYGDDVILPSSCYPEYLKLVNLLGFTINQEKSFSSGSFRESCGAHWFQGVDVKPFYQKDLLVEPSDYYSIHNRIVEFAHRCLGQFALDARFRRVTREIRRYLHASDVLFVSAHLGDVGLYSNLDRALTLKTTSVKRSVGYKIRISSEVPVTLHFDGYGLVLDRLRSTSTHQRKSLGDHRAGKARGNQVPLKSSVTRKQRSITVGFGQWYYLGLWI